ncbi:MAG TPA: helix-turn-helix transcriptional regulator, partial [Bacillota bacterium]|nr:helix-turn-helix transcriptional regulator [Bacillota bacterium]
VTRQTISLYANGQAVPDIYKAQLIADYFGVSIGYLLSNTEVTAFYNNEQFEDYCKVYGGDTYFNICTLLRSLTDEAQRKVLDRIQELKEIPKYNVEYQEYLANSKGGEK